ncbi:DNA polymerase Y family protein [Caulobacter sp. S45]|uniref:Y-family DNA polymerase n=1 Tax=Caulobacter sp. S45 TaxID=1641861 RepID=UPI00131C743C|nr:DNA polymerase Y family protein [Caulobacter sp. S45]
MRRVVSISLPSWPTDRIRRRLGPDAPPADTPVVTIGRDGRKRVVLAANAPALGLGLRPGVPAAKARALVADLILHDADLQDDALALERLALWALRRYSPLVAPDPPDGLILDVTGAAHRFGGEDALLADMIDRLAAVGVTARAAMAGSWGAAHALARFAADPRLVVASDRSGLAAGALPIRALRLSADLVDTLERLGFETIGDLERQPRAPLALRFGIDLTRRLDQVYGRVNEPIDLVEAPDPIQVRRAFAEPVGAPETLARYTLQLVEGLCAILETKGLGARTLDLRFLRVDNRVEAIRIGTAQPVRDIARLTRLLCDKLETVDPGFGVEVMVLTASLAEPLDWKPGASDLIAAPEADVSALVDTLANRLGERRLYRMTPGESDVPERSVQRIAPTAPATGASWSPAWPRPSRLLARPEPIETVALLPDQPPVSFTWRGTRRRVRRADGPERIFGEWWRRDGELDAVRDYFQLEDTAGERYWVFRRGDGERAATGDLSWFMHGLFG